VGGAALVGFVISARLHPGRELTVYRHPDEVEDEPGVGSEQSKSGN
jgi:hypothetical protein